MVGPYKYSSLVNEDIFVNYLLVEKVAEFEKFIKSLLVCNVFLDPVKEGYVIRE